jgi:transcriptional regulator with XRE-family HTH domain
MEGLRTVRKKAGYSQEELAARIGTSRPNVSAYESGGRTMSLKIANKVLEEIGETEVTGEELVIGNRLLAYKRARESGDVPGMFEAARMVAKIKERVPLTRKGDELVDEIVTDALEYAEKATGGFEDEDDQDDLDGDGRDFFGRVITRVRSTGGDPEDNRDAFGRSIQPEKSGDPEDGQDEDDEDDGRDMYGRRI